VFITATLRSSRTVLADISMSESTSTRIRSGRPRSASWSAATAPVAPAILDAIVQANEGFAAAYGDDDWTRSVERRLSELFEREVAVFLVATETASNALALAHLAPPWGMFLFAVASSGRRSCSKPERPYHFASATYRFADDC
jgi:hypothetical protein